ncbi:hypothetical protein V2H77_07865 [Photorhabdus sp. P32]|uniref:hypothetical protein n=1 Tax=Photorhabdus sp. P32 TaxID=3117549 RepID=UPI00311B1AB7
MSIHRPYKEAINFPDSKKAAEQEIMNFQAKIPELKRLRKIKANSPDGKLNKGSKRVLPDKSCYSSYYYYY